MKQRSRARRAEEERPGDYSWIVDGHNAIFAVEEWERLQLAGQKREARQRLERRLEEFGRAIARQVLVVYDGNQLERNPDAVDRAHLRSVYSLPEEADDHRDPLLGASRAARGAGPVVVTSDRRTLAPSLPPGVRWMRCAPVSGAWSWRDSPERTGGAGRQAGLDDIERYWLGEGAPPRGQGRSRRRECALSVPARFDTLARFESIGPAGGVTCGSISNECLSSASCMGRRADFRVRAGAGLREPRRDRAARRRRSGGERLADTSNDPAALEKKEKDLKAAVAKNPKDADAAYALSAISTTISSGAEAEDAYRKVLKPAAR
ncbi:MAG: NYN domain-containing protein [Candidatus Eisenbacteria bacterium]